MKCGTFIQKTFSFHLLMDIIFIWISYKHIGYAFEIIKKKKIGYAFVCQGRSEMVGVSSVLNKILCLNSFLCMQYVKSFEGEFCCLFSGPAIRLCRLVQSLVQVFRAQKSNIKYIICLQSNVIWWLNCQLSALLTRVRIRALPHFSFFLIILYHIIVPKT